MFQILADSSETFGYATLETENGILKMPFFVAKVLGKLVHVCSEKENWGSENNRLSKSLLVNSWFVTSDDIRGFSNLDL